MNRTRLLRSAAILAAAALSLAATSQIKPAPTKQNPWAAQVSVTPSGSHVLGNPEAGVKLVEYMSYTCPHCAAFEADAAPTLRYGVIPSGKGSFEIRHFLRDPMDLAVALLTSCGKPARFWSLHHSFLVSQEKWLGAAQKTTEAQRARWTSGPLAGRMRAIASDLHFYDILENNGVDRFAADRCLGDEAAARRLTAQTVEGQKLGVDGTPSFFIGETLLAGTHDWKSLKPQLDARF